MVKRIGGGRKPAKQIEFELVAYKGDEEVVHSFTAGVRGIPAELVQVAARAEKDPSRAAAPLVRLLGKLMSDKDGVPTTWQPLPLDKDDPSYPEVSGAPCYRDPEGVVRPFSDHEKLDELQSVEAGSSRRRWRWLMEEDEDAVVEMQDLMEVAEYLISEGSERPTERHA